MLNPLISFIHPPNNNNNNNNNSNSNSNNRIKIIFSTKNPFLNYQIVLQILIVLFNKNYNHIYMCVCVCARPDFTRGQIFTVFSN